ncbi:hypothetical protein [Flavobacterium oreochromis]|uniref:Uncharacterized protein n=2 Tax=Flavobacterium TaxID=237 RepID=A0A246G773_9FLAO|nr:hypothetical protein [Flavobacterium oreochromis]OWP74200.1 hypothetical protein BWK62_14835 [Flavobacterium oreochromis]OWP75038.1 hypothetical protein BWG23_12245 [Flavobacterium oreochromis]
MKINLIFIFFILNAFYPCRAQERAIACKNKFDLNSINFKKEKELNKIFRLEVGFYGTHFTKNKEWLINKNDIRGYIYRLKDTSTCISFFNEKIIANHDYTIYLDLTKKIYAYSLQAKGVERIENNINQYMTFYKKYLSTNLSENESKKLFQNFPGNEKILKFDFPDKIVMINYINNDNYPNSLIIRVLTKNTLEEESYNIIDQEYEIYIQ